MKATFTRSYRSKKGNATFVYNVQGTKDELKAFKTAQGAYYRESDEGTPLFFTTRFIGDDGILLITTNGNIVPDMSAFDKQASLAEQYGGNFGNALAQQGINKLKNDSSNEE